MRRKNNQTAPSKEKFVLPNDSFVALHHALIHAFKDPLMAAIIQEIHYWTCLNREKDRNYYDGHYWVYNTMKEWHENHFSWVSYNTVQRRFSQLEKMGIVVSGKYNRNKTYHRKWYRINYSELERFLRSKGFEASLDYPKPGQSNAPKRGDPLPHDESFDYGSVGHSNKTENTTNKLKAQTRPRQDERVVSGQVSLDWTDQEEPQGSLPDHDHDKPLDPQCTERLYQIFEVYVERPPSEIEQKHLLRMFKRYPDLYDIEDAFLEFVVQRDKQRIASPCGYVEGVLKQWSLHGKRTTNMLEHLQKMKKSKSR